MRPEDERYFERIEDRLDEAFAVASEARARGRDPEPEVEIPLAQDMAGRVENILGIDGVAERVRELEGEMSREEAALVLAEDFAEGRVGDYDTDAGRVEGAVRTAVALLTEGVVAAPIEGIDRVETIGNADGTEAVRVFYAGPVRSAGGTAQALSVLVADYARALLGLSAYEPRDDEVERYVEEVGLYDDEAGLQYSPSDAEARFVARNCPVMLDGEATGDEEVSGYRDLERVDTNSPRGGMCLVLAEGIALKAPKIKRYTGELDEVEWPWLDDLMAGSYGEGDRAEAGDADDPDDANGDDDPDDGDDAAGDSAGDGGPPRVEPSGKYLRDLIAGRPVFSHPSTPGGFRLRYGRARNHGFATAGVHPATMHLVDDFLATGTQIKTERPGKAAGVVPVDSIEGPTVRLANGEVRRIDDPEEALAVRNGVEAILDLGEYLVNYGEFVENNHPLAPASYTYEWWIREFERTDADVQALRDAARVDLREPEPGEALSWATEYDAPLHPAYTYCWHDASVAEFEALAAAVADGTVVEDALHLRDDEAVRRTLERLLVEHVQGEAVVVPDWRPLARSLGVSEDLDREWTDLSEAARGHADGENAVEAVNEVAPFAVRERAPTRVGNRMGRPEKSEQRELSPAVHALFPIGEAGGDQRDVAEAAGSGGANGDDGTVTVGVGRRECVDCGTETHEARCPSCGSRTEPIYECPDCEVAAEPDEAGRVECPRCGGAATSVERRSLDVHAEYHGALDAVGERESAFDVLKGVKGLTSRDKTPEPLEKGVLRAKHGVSTFKDGTVRYDMTDLPVTAVRPAEVGVTAERFRELGYETDVRGDPLRHDDQLVHLRVQDVVVSTGAADHLLRTADFVDDLLVAHYGLEAFYEFDGREDLVGELVFGLAPHTSAAVVGRIVGFTTASVGYAHPYFHAAKRRNCFHPETKIWYEDETGRWRHERIETVVERRLTDPRTDDFGALVDDLPGDIRVPSVDGDGNTVYRPVEAVSKHPSPDHLLRVETRSGRVLRVTPDHSMRRWSDGVERVEATEIEVGDVIPTPKTISLDGRVVEFDLLEEFLAADAVPAGDLMVRGVGEERIKRLFDRATPESGHLGPVADRLDRSSSSVYNWIARDSVPAAAFVELFGASETLELLPDDVGLGIRRDAATVDRQFAVDERVATLLGYYAAEGFTRREPGNFYQTTVCTPDEPARRELSECFEDALGVEAFEENEWKLTVSSRLVAVLFGDVLACGSRAEDKRVPDCVLGSTESVLRAFLSAYFSGDGSASGSRVEIRAHTVSDDLKSDLVAALKRFGVATKTYRESRTPTTGAVAEFYDDPRTFETWVLKVSSENAARFADRVGFHLERKDRTLRQSLESTGTRTQRLFGDGGDVWLDEVESVEVVKPVVDHTYSVTVADTNALVANDLFVGQCDGDEDCVMLLLDGLLNFSKCYLPDKRGGSVAEDSRLVAIDPDGDVRFLTFREFWESLDSPVERDGKFRKKTCRAEGWQTYAFDDAHRAAPRPIEKAIRYEAGQDEVLLRVETQFGRAIDITRNHSLFRYDDGIEEVAGAELREGDLVVAPRELDVEPTAKTIDVADCVDDPYVFITDEVESVLTRAWQETERGSGTHGAFETGLSYRLDKNKLSLDRFNRILDAHGEAVEVPDLRIGLQGSSTGIEEEIQVDEEFGWLMGMFVSEGTLSSVCPAIHNADEELIERVVRVAEAVLGRTPETRWSNEAYEVRFPAVFREVLFELGFANAESYNSTEKVIPRCILRAPREVVISFLRGFVDGDGSRTSDDNHTSIQFHTTSEDVKDGVVFLLHRLGLVANVSRRADRDGNRQPIFAVSVSGGATDNPLRRVLDGDDPYLPKSLVASVPDALVEIREMDVDGVKQLVPRYLKRRDNLSLAKLRGIVAELESRELPAAARDRLADLRPLVDGDLSYLRVKRVERVEYDGYLYDLQVGGEPKFSANWLYAHNSMDAPLVMTSRIDPAEIDDEAHNMDVVPEYPLEFYEATRRMADPGEVDVAIAGDSLGTEEQYAGFAHTHDTSDLALGPELSAYKTLGSMMDKMDAQLELARKLRAVEERDVAERVIEYHFLPDLIGNLRAFSQQETRCLGCGTKYRRVPLSGECRNCGGDVNLTVHEGSVSKYMDAAIEVAEEYGSREYTKQRLHILERSLERTFENDRNKQSGIADFM